MKKLFLIFAFVSVVLNCSSQTVVNNIRCVTYTPEVKYFEYHLEDDKSYFVDTDDFRPLLRSSISYSSKTKKLYKTNYDILPNGKYIKSSTVDFEDIVVTLVKRDNEYNYSFMMVIGDRYIPIMKIVSYNGLNAPEVKISSLWMCNDIISD